MLCYNSNIINKSNLIKRVSNSWIEGRGYSYETISAAIRIAERTAVTNNTELASNPDDFKIENFLTLTS